MEDEDRLGSSRLKVCGCRVKAQHVMPASEASFRGRAAARIIALSSP